MAVELRASDQERELAASQLREHAATGRLTVEELTSRLEATFAAKTTGDLEAQFRDLPASPDPKPSQRPRPRASTHTRVYILVCLGMAALWALCGMGYFWPIWPIFGWGIGVVLSHRARAGRCSTRSAPSGVARPGASSPLSE